MRLFLGKENMLSYSNQFDDVGPWDSPTAALKGATLSPDGSTYALIYSGDNASWHNVTTNNTVFPMLTHENKAYIISFFAKPENDSVTTSLLAYLSDAVSEYWGMKVEFADGTVDAFYSAPGGNHYGVANLGYNNVGNGWFKFWGLYDVRDNMSASQQNCEFRLYPNSNGNPVNNVGVGLWGVQIEKTNRRSRPIPTRLTDGTAFVGADCTMIEFTQLPSNIDEVLNDFYTTEKDAQGEVIRRRTSINKNLQKLVWRNINYKTHGHMIYVMRESLRDKLGRDCVLEYPHKIHRTVRSADIRVVDFKFDYSLTPNMASVELHYVVEQTYPY